MYLPPPGKIAIIGAGPIGLEAALYARYLGYAVEIFERGRVAENVLRQGDAAMTTPFVLNASPLGLAALAAQDESFRPPQVDELLTACEWVERYLQPLAQSDLIIDGLHQHTTVVNVQRLPAAESPSDEPPDEDDDAPLPPSLRLHWQLAPGEQSHTDANVVFECSGKDAPALTAVGEPNCYLLGGTSGDDEFTFAQGLAQIRDLFKGIADRAGLDLYAIA